jgi:site-specific recombinase XerD
MRFSDLARGFTDYLVARRGDQFVGYLVSAGRPNDAKEFTAENVDGFASWAAARGVGGNTIRNRLSALSALAKYAMRVKAPRGHGYVLDGNPVDRVERPRFAEPPEKWLTLDELHAMVVAAEGASPCDRLAFAAVLDQPLRASEWCSANVADLTLAAGDKVALEVRVKGGARRKKVLGDRLAADLTRTLREREAKPAEPLLLNGRGTRYTRQGFSGIINRIAQRAGLGRAVRAHAIRHAVASLAAHHKASQYEIAEMLNHRSLATAQRYIHGVSPDRALASVREALVR